MGVCYLQHRSVTGTYNSSTPQLQSSKVKTSNLQKGDVRCVLYTLIIIVYAYLVCMILAVAAELLNKDIPHTYKNVNFIQSSTIGVHFEIRMLINSWVFIIVSMLLKFNFPVVCYITKSLGFVKRLGMSKLGGIQKIGIFLSFWLTIINLLLIVISNPAIKNPGPTLENFTVLYQNVRGFVPFRALGKDMPLLDNDKLVEFQSYVFENKPCLVVLNETWLSKDHLDNEIFPNDSYRCFRLDRSLKTHPMDPSNKDKFKTRGGGVMFALRSDLSIEPKQIAIKSKAEILNDCLLN